MSDVDPLVPRWLQVSYACLRCAPWTEIKTAIAAGSVPCTGLFLVVASFKGKEINVAALDSWLLFLTGAWGIATVAQGWQRAVNAKAALASSTKDGGP